MFEGLKDFVRNNCFVIVIALVIALIVVIIVFGMGIGLAAKSENMKLPWKNKERLFSGDLTPQEQKMFVKMNDADPVNSAWIREKMSNKEVPALVAKLYQ